MSSVVRQSTRIVFTELLVFTGLLAVVVCFAVSASTAEAIGPDALYIFPAGGQRGTTVGFKVGGLYLHKGCSFEMVGPGVEASDRIVLTDTLRFDQEVVPQSGFAHELTRPSDYSGTVRIAADAPAVHPYWRVWTSQGVTSIKRFVIGDLPEIVEQEIAGDPIRRSVELPLTINGRIYPREDVDVWSFDAVKGQSITCEVRAARLGSTLDPRIEVRDARGERIAENTDHFGADSFLRFTAPEEGAYHVRIHDVRFGGMPSSVYRLTITSDRYVDGVYPLGGQRGENVRFKLIGQAVPDEPVEIALPREGPRDFAPRLELDGPVANEVLIDLSEFPEHLEAESNDDADRAGAFALPAVINGRIDTPGDVDVWALSVRKNERIAFEFRARRPGSPLNPVLVVLDASGKEIHRGEGRSEFTFPADGMYHLRIEAMFSGRGGPRFAYRLQVSRPPPPAPDFSLELAQLECAVPRGGSAELTVNARRTGGFKGEIELTVDGLPTGVTAAATKITAGKNSAKVKLTAAKENAIGVSRVTVRGSFEFGGKHVIRTATKSLDGGRVTIDAVCLAVTMPTPFKFEGTYTLPFGLQGTVHYRHFEIERGGYDGPIHVRLADRQIRHQQGTTGPTIKVPAGVSAFDYPLQISTWTEVGLTSRTVLMVFADIEAPDGRTHTVAYTSSVPKDQIIMQPNAGPLSIDVDRPSVIAWPGDPVEFKVRVRRDPELQTPVRVELLPAGHLRGVEAAPIELAVGQNEAAVRVWFASGAGPFNVPLEVRATARLTRPIRIRGSLLREGDEVTAVTSIGVIRTRFRRF